MYQILKKQTLNANTKPMVIEAAFARKAEPGQFIILRCQRRRAHSAHDRRRDRERVLSPSFSRGRRNDDGARRAE